MKEPRLVSVITTINAPSRAMGVLAKAMHHVNGQLLVVGDKKGPARYPLASTELLSLEQQLRMPFRLSKRLPLNHYARKNLGYLVAIARGATTIYESDDDNQPSADWALRTCDTRAIKVIGQEWCNVFHYFTSDNIWPRGFPLDLAGSQSPPKKAKVVHPVSVHSPIQQGLVDLNPDVDAVWRLVIQGRIRFRKAPSVALTRGVWCPFNSQSTWWWPEAYPLMYLPSFCTFRMTDIWRSFVAQRCLWELGAAVTFHAPEVEQHRNAHDLTRDFADEIPGYLYNRQISRLLGELDLEPGRDALQQNMLRCYETMVQHDLFPRGELVLLKAWFQDFEKVASGLNL